MLGGQFRQPVVWGYLRVRPDPALAMVQRRPIVGQRDAKVPIASATSTEAGQAEMTDAHAEDPCCGPHLDAALLAGLVDSWECPECGCLWVARIVAGAVRWWEPVPVVTFVKRRR